MTIEECINHFGSVQKLANALNVSRQAIHQWAGDAPPLHRQYELQIKTNNALKANITEAKNEH